MRVFEANVFFQKTFASKVIPELQKPSLTTTPTTTKKDSVKVEVNGKVGTTVFVNGIDESSKWEHSEDVNIQDGYLKLINNLDGDSKRSTIITLDTSSYTSLTLEKRSKIIAKGNYSLSSIVFYVGKNSSRVNYNSKIPISPQGKTTCNIP